MDDKLITLAQALLASDAGNSVKAELEKTEQGRELLAEMEPDTSPVVIKTRKQSINELLREQQ